VESTYKIFNERIKEIDFYYEALTQLAEAIAQSLGNSIESKKTYKQENFLKILKANALLMIYNFVESTLLNGISEIYDKLRFTGATYLSVRKEIKDIWFSYKFKQAYQPEAHYRTYKSKALEIVNSIMIGETIDLNRKSLSIDGNIDADIIRNVCYDHGITFSPDRESKGGERLKDVKLKRNELAHGTLSFAECGRDYSLEDLVKIKDQTKIFLTGLLEGMKRYYDYEEYLDHVE